MQELADDLLKLLEGYPAAFTNAFPISEASFSSIENFLALEQYSLMVPMLIIFMLVAIAGSALAAEIEHGTAEILLARPISRLRIFFARYSVGIFSLLLFIIFSTFMIIPLGELHNVDYTLANFTSISILCFVFGWAVFSIAMVLSAIFSEMSKVYMIIGGILVGMYVLLIISGISDKWQNVQYGSFFYYYDHNQALLHNTLDAFNVTLFIVIAVMCTSIAAYRFNKRDIAV